jgi:hypothetical protein
MIALWDIASCSLVEVDRHFRRALMMEAVRTSETSVYFNKTTWCYIPEVCHLHSCHGENLKSHVVVAISIACAAVAVAT